MQELIIRRGVQADLPRVLELVKELAEYEKALDQVSNTVEQMERDGFGPDPLYGFFVAEQEGSISGMAVYYWRYSTWKGRRLYLEDIVVTETMRGQGAGQELFETCMRFALENGSSGMMWQALHWNEPAFNFYRRYGTNLDNEWVNCSLEREQMQAHLGLT